MTTLPLELQLKIRAWELHVPTLTEAEVKEKLVFLYTQMVQMDARYSQLLGKAWGVCDG